MPLNFYFLASFFKEVDTYAIVLALSGFPFLLLQNI